MAASIAQDVGPSSPAAESSADAVCVAVHIRPLVAAEMAEGCQPCLTITPGQPQACFSWMPSSLVWQTKQIFERMPYFHDLSRRDWTEDSIVYGDSRVPVQKFFR